ncbi:MAG: hypothetical protein E7L40_04830 [Corynebacterium kroppenstedtii]|nr:hypothetical protein [Corynebacterium kroppenstedtii]
MFDSSIQKFWSDADLLGGSVYRAWCFNHHFSGLMLVLPRVRLALLTHNEHPLLLAQHPYKQGAH